MNEEVTIDSAQETITLKQYDWISVKTAAIQLTLFDDEVYNVSLIIFVNEEFPLILETNIYCSDEECAILQGYGMITNLADSIFDCISVFDENGDELEDLSLNDYLEMDEDIE